MKPFASDGGRGMRRVILRSIGVATIGAVIALNGCGAAPSKSATTLAPVISQSLPTTKPVVAVAVTVTNGALPTVPAGQIQDCVDYVQYGAYTGNALLLGIWKQAEQDVVKLRATCTSIGVSDPSSLAAMSSQWTAIKTYIAAGQTSQPTTSPTSPLTPTPPSVAPLPPVTTQPAATTQPQRNTLPPTRSPSPTTCADGSYVNVDGNCIPGPRPAPSAPAGATAQCNDGTYSFSQNRSGTCSHHGGVAVWL